MSVRWSFEIPALGNRNSKDNPFCLNHYTYSCCVIYCFIGIISAYYGPRSNVLIAFNSRGLSIKTLTGQWQGLESTAAWNRHEYWDASVYNRRLLRCEGSVRFWFKEKNFFSSNFRKWVLEFWHAWGLLNSKTMF